MDCIQLNRRLTLQSKSVTRDGMGGEVISWVTQATVWAAVWSISGREFLSAQQVQSEVTWKVMIRYRTDVKADWRAVDGSAIYDIRAVLPNQDRTMLTLMCATGVKEQGL